MSEVYTLNVDQSTKVCGKCKLSQPHAAFSRDKKSRDGFCWNCKKCVSEYKRALYLSNPQAVKDRVKAWLALQPPKPKKPKPEKPATPEFLICTACKQEKPTSKFPARPEGRYGLNTRCRECLSRQHNQYVSRPRLPPPCTEKACVTCGQTKQISDFRKDRGCKYGFSNVCLMCANAKAREGFARNRDHRNEKSRQSWIMNKEQIKARYARYRQQEKYKNIQRQHMAKRRAQMKKTTVEKVNYNAIFERDKGVCYLCSKAVELNDIHFDHVIPLSKGGSHSMSNIRVTHSLCNLRKHTKIVTVPSLQEEADNVI